MSVVRFFLTATMIINIVLIAAEKSRGVSKMNNKPICCEWHGNDVMPIGNKLCIFEIKVGEASEILIGYRQCDTIVRESCDCEFVCFEDAVIRWCYIDLN